MPAGIQNLSMIKASIRKAALDKVAKLEKGLKKAGLVLQAESMKIVPVDYGNLKSSAFTRADRSGNKITVVVGYTAGYAIYVHENLDAAHGQAFNIKHAAELADAKKGKVHTGPFRHNRGVNQQAKFLEAPFRRLSSDGTLKGVIASEMA